MLTAAWAVGLAIRLLAVGRISRLRWCIKLPLFSSYLVIGLCQMLSTAYWVYIGKDMQSANRWYEVIGYFSTVARVAMYVEAFSWFVFCLPNFRVIGLYLMGTCAICGASADLWVNHVQYAADQFRMLAAIERWTGIGVAVAIIIALGFFQLIGAMNESAKWHAIILSGWSLSNAVGWLEFGKRNYEAAGWLMVGGNIIAVALWMLFVKGPPTWKAPLAAGTDEDMKAAIKRMEQAGKRKPGTRLDRAGSRQ